MNTISKRQAHRVFKYGTHKQLKNSVDRWVNKGIAVPTDKYYDVKVKNAHQYELWVRDSSWVYKTGFVVVPEPEHNGYSLLGASL